MFLTNYLALGCYNGVAQRKSIGKGGDVVYIIHVDLVFVINFLADGCLLFLVKHCLKQTATWLRLILGSALGALGACLMICLPLFREEVIRIAGTLLLATLMVWVTYKPRQPLVLIQNVLTLYVCAGLLGGVLHSIYYNTEFIYHLNQWAHLAHPTFLKWVLLWLPGLGICGFLLYFDTNRRRAKQYIYPIEIETASRVIRTTGLLDTGNQLLEPITQKPVCVIEDTLMKELIGGDIAQSKCYVIPYKAIGTSQGMMAGLVVDRIRIYGPRGKVYETPQGMLGLSAQQLSENGSYHLIIHPQYLEI